MAQLLLQKTWVQLLAPTWQHITTCNISRSSAPSWYLQAEYTHGQRRWHGGSWELRGAKHTVLFLSVERCIHGFLPRGWEWMSLVPFALSCVAAATLDPPQTLTLRFSPQFLYWNHCLCGFMSFSVWLSLKLCCTCKFEFIIIRKLFSKLYCA